MKYPVVAILIARPAWGKWEQRVFDKFSDASLARFYLRVSKEAGVTPEAAAQAIAHSLFPEGVTLKFMPRASTDTSVLFQVSKGDRQAKPTPQPPPLGAA